MRISDWSSDVCSSDLKADLAAVVPAEGGGELAVSDGDAVEALQEIDMEEGAAELAVGDALEPDVLLALRHLADAVVLDPAQGLAGDLARRVLLARLDEAPGPQKAAHVVGAEWALQGHPDVSWFSRLLVGLLYNVTG